MKHPQHPDVREAAKIAKSGFEIHVRQQLDYTLKLRICFCLYRRGIPLAKRRTNNTDRLKGEFGHEE
jgi:hypothetical protein